jgi:threonine/homoserine/homoserine lactone efflux protein
MHQKFVKLNDFKVHTSLFRQWSCTAIHHLNALFKREERVLAGVGCDTDNHLVHKAQTALDDIKMPIGDWIKRAWIYAYSLFGHSYSPRKSLAISLLASNIPETAQKNKGQVPFRAHSDAVEELFVMALPVDPLLFWLFVGAVTLLVLTPGPIVSLIIAETLNESPKHGFAVVAGAEVVGIVMLAVYLLGFSAIIEFLSDDVLTAVRYGGAAYLAYLAFKSFRKNDSGDDPKRIVVERTPAKAFKAAIAVAATNPKAILFFAAFFPQFISPDMPAMPQLITLSIVFAVLAPILDCVWVLAATGAREILRRKGSVSLIGKISGTILAVGACALLLINK